MATNNSKAVTTMPPPQKTNPSTKNSKGSLDRDTALAQLNNDKKSAFIKAWEESEKSRVDNKAQKKLSKVAAWENSKKAHLEAKLKKLEERLEQKKAEYAEKMKNRAALIHKEAEEKKAMVNAKRGEQILKTEEMAAKYRATGQTPKKLLGCVG
ncbi:remorin-like isoform X1 [Nicotiana tabacum]|uniref:Remorin-like n=1 Tax=Nicotiana tabacum TaxID=4097 RepID=A0A1S3Z218_TOBAC|nr:remorin-like isoform X1 [Nicotiana tomentosiformis]XP_016458207.1 PREDICTED: remorin-like [Nicotiana tabacum]